MLENFISFVRRFLGLIDPVWVLLGALAVAALILLVGFIMTIHTAKSLSKRNSCLHAIRSYTRRNVIFTIAFIFVIVAVFAIFYEKPFEMHTELVIPALVLLWAFFCEAMFELMDNRNRKRVGLKVCYCVCVDDDCEVDLEGITKSREEKTKTIVKKVIPQKHVQQKHVAVKTETSSAKHTHAHKPKHEVKEVRKETKVVTHDHDEEDNSVRSQIHEHLKRAEEAAREHEEHGTRHKEHMEAKAHVSSEEEELRRQRFEEHRKHLAVMARQAKAAQFADERPTYERPAPKPVVKPAPVSAPSGATHRKPEGVQPAPAPKHVETVRVETAPVERTVETTVTRTVHQSHAQSVSKSESTDARFGSLQAKLDVLKKDTATAAAKTESTGKYNQSEVRTALDDLLKSMRARRGEDE